MNPNPNPTQTQTQSVDYAPYPKLDPEDVAPQPPPPSAADTWTSVPVGPEPDNPPLPPPQQQQQQSRDAHPPPPPPHEGGPAPISSTTATTIPPESNPYVSPSPAPGHPSSMKEKMDTMKDVLGKWGKKAAEATKKAEDLAGNMWQHLKTSPNLADAAVGRIAQGTKVLAEGGYEKIFRQTFETVPEENLLKSYACYLSTSAGPVMGTLYLSTAKLAFGSDNPLSYKVGEETQWSYYKVVLPLHQLRAINTSTSKVNSAEKYIQIISVDNHEFWFMGFVYYEDAVKSVQGALQPAQP